MGMFDLFKKKSSRLNLQNNLDKSTDDIETQKEGYCELINSCIGESKKNELIVFIGNLNNYNEDSDYQSTLNFVMSHLDENNIHFIMSLDWKQEITDLEWRITSSLRDNFNTVVDLPNIEIYGEDASVSCKNVFKDYDSALRKNNFQLSFIDTNGDEYVIIVHRTEDKQLVNKAIKKIGYECLDADSPKINGES